MQLQEYLIIAAAYLVGSIPFGQIFFWLTRRGDVRDHGSGNIGATNVFRTAGPIPGILTAVFDVSKGLFPALIAVWAGVEPQSWTIGLVAFAAVLGHMFPIWLMFRGGKGAATAAGAFFAISWQITLIVLVIFAGSIALSGIVSLGTLIATASCVVLCFTIGDWFGLAFPMKIAATLITAFIWLKHHENIGRLLRGEEKRLFGGKKKKPAGEDA